MYVVLDRCLSFCTFLFGHCVVCSSSIYDSDYPFGIFKLKDPGYSNTVQTGVKTNMSFDKLKLFINQFLMII